MKKKLVKVQSGQKFIINMLKFKKGWIKKKKIMIIIKVIIEFIKLKIFNCKKKIG